MKYLIAIGLLGTGLIIGYYWGKSVIPVDETNDETTTEMLTEVIRDTIIQTETIKIPVASEERDSILIMNDSLRLPFDSLVVEVVFEDTTENDEELDINREKLMRSIKIPINYLVIKEESDTIIKDLLGIENTKPTHIFVEFWQSPLNFEGYKLSKSKLILYGLSTQFNYKFYRKSDDFYLAYQDIYYLMNETQDFLPYLQVEKDVVFND